MYKMNNNSAEIIKKNVINNNKQKIFNSDFPFPISAGYAKILVHTHCQKKLL